MNSSTGVLIDLTVSSPDPPQIVVAFYQRGA
jgi:hypothetical protein